MFIKNLCLIVNNDKAFLSEPITIFLGDKDIRLQIMLKQVRNQFNTKVLNDLDVLDLVESCEVVIQKPNGELFTATAHVENKIVIIDIDSTWTDELAEVGVHLVQLILLSGDGGHITLPTVEVMVAKPLEFREGASEQIESDFYSENGIAFILEDGSGGIKISELEPTETGIGWIPMALGSKNYKYALKLHQYAKIEHTHKEYLKEHQDISHLATKEEMTELRNDIPTMIDGMVTSTSITKIEVVDELPTKQEQGVLYIVKAGA